MSATAGVNSRDVTRIVTCCPPVPVNEYRSAKWLVPNTGDVQSPVVSVPRSVWTGAIANGASALHSMNVAAKSSSRVVVKSREGGLKAYVPRVAVAVYVVPGSKPVWNQTPESFVCTGDGSAPEPSTRENVIMAPPSPMPPAVTTPATGNRTVVLASARLTTYRPIRFSEAEVTSMMYVSVAGRVKNVVPDRRRPDVPLPHVTSCMRPVDARIMATAGVNAFDVTRTATCWPAVPVEE